MFWHVEFIALIRYGLKSIPNPLARLSVKGAFKSIKARLYPEPGTHSFFGTNLVKNVWSRVC